MRFLSFYEANFSKYLTPSQLEVLKILIWLIQVHKQIRIERLAACFPFCLLVSIEHSGKTKMFS
jgi:hypothetical protein